MNDITLSYTMYPADLPEDDHVVGNEAEHESRGGAGRPRPTIEQ